ncbi:MAG: hypothetical protein IJ630_10895 [Treponema sp.]|nr:hypothetical protein [Treponema sp.]
MKKIVKNIFVFAGFVISALNFSIFTGCSDINTKTAANGTYKISGNVSLGTKSGASPSYFRSATTDFEIPEDYSWDIVAYKYDSATGADDTTEYYPIFSDGPYFTFSFTESASYQITASLHDSKDSVCAQASEIIDTSETENLEMTASPVFSTVTGSVSLPVFIDTSLSSTISSVEVLWLGLGERTSLILQKLGFSSEDKVQDDDVEAKIAALNEWNESCENGDFNNSFTFTDNKAQIEISGIFPGSHSVKLNFNDSTGNTLYSCTEIINVYSGFVTDTWYGTAPYLSEGSFCVDSSLIKNYGTQVVPDTKILLYAYDSDFNCNYYLTDDASSVNSDTTPTAIRDSDIEYNAFCFDGDGDVYYLASVDTLPDNPIYTIKSTNSQKSDITTSQNLQSITYDAKNSALYGASFIDGDLTIYKFDLSTGECEKTYTFNLDIDSYTLYDFYALTVYDEKAYFAIKYADSDYNETICLCACDLSDTVIYFTDCTIYTVTKSTDGTYSDSAEIKDMIYQDGYVYILLRDVDLSPWQNLYFYSRGAVLKYNTYQNSITELGLASYQSPYEKYLYTYDSSGNQWKTSSDEDAEPVLVEASALYDESNTEMFALYSPETTDDSQYFYGPAKFIAIKPKKLVIADDGVAFYTDSLGAYKYKNVNRIVEVDLESFAISGTSTVDESVEFDFNGSSGSGYIETSKASIYYSQETGYAPKAYYYDTATSSHTQINDRIYAGANCIYSTECFGESCNIRPVIIEGSEE